MVDEVLKRLGRKLSVDELDGAALDLVVQRGDGFVNGILEGEALDVDLLGLAESVDAPRRLRLLFGVAARVSGCRLGMLCVWVRRLGTGLVFESVACGMPARGRSQAP